VNVGARAISLQFKIPLAIHEIKSIANRLRIFQTKKPPNCGSS
jgi:DNA/RNA-binding domain of Phe-tRNA-synthetase-like protein